MNSFCVFHLEIFMTLEYTYDTYASDYTIDSKLVEYFHKTDVRDELTTISNTLMERIGLFGASDIPENGKHPSGIEAFFAIYAIPTTEGTFKETRATFLFTKQNGSSTIENVDIYRAECNIIANENQLQMTGCKVYYTPSHFARQNITILRIGGEGPSVFLGVCGRGPVVPEEDWTPILLSGISFDLTDGFPSENSHILTPPKSFFVEGEHEDFAPPGKYPLAFFEEC